MSLIDLYLSTVLPFLSGDRTVLRAVTAIPFFIWLTMSVELHVYLVFLGLVSAVVHKYFIFQIMKLFGSWHEKADPVWVLLYLLKC